MRLVLAAPGPADNRISNARVGSVESRRAERPRHASVFHSDNLPAEIERCEREIASVEHALLSGYPDVAGLCLALSDWSAEQRILKEQQRWKTLRPIPTERAWDRQPGREC